MEAQNMVDRQDLLTLAVRVAAQGAALAQLKRREFITDVRTKSTDTDVVTAADVAVERLIIDALRQVRPGDGVLSEESGESIGSPADRDSGSSIRWILDPIDGTVNYLYGVPYYAVSLAAELDGVVVAGVVHNIATGVVWTATLGGGAFCGERALAGSPVTQMSQALVATGFGYDAARRTHQAGVLAGLAGRIRDIRRQGAGALDLCAAASGLVDAYYEKGLSEWDHAAGVLIAREAGLVVSGLRRADPGQGFVLAAPPAIHRELHTVLVDLDADGGP
jgi:myo-inositol-1(or 4)-monophosphatase